MTKLWSYRMPGKEPVYSSPVGPVTLYSGATPYACVLFSSWDWHVYALKVSDGTLLWRYATGDKILGGANWTPSPEGDAVRILVGSYDSHLHCVDAATGAKVWTYATDSFVNGTPAVAQGMAVFGGCDAGLHLVDVANGARIRKIDLGSYVAGSAAVAGGHAYVGHMGGEFLCGDSEAGEVGWRCGRPRGEATHRAAIRPIPHRVPVKEPLTLQAPMSSRQPPAKVNVRVLSLAIPVYVPRTSGTRS